MSFVSFAFAVLYGVVLVARFVFGRSKCERSYLGVLLVASLVFYGWHTPAYLFLILASTSVDYLAGRALAQPTKSPRARKLVLAISVAVNLGLLFFFKYVNFLAMTVARVLESTSIHVPTDLVSHELPIGISFYTFQSMSYTIDVYRRQLRPEPTFLKFFLFVSFFPQLVAGPIVRARDFLRQLPRKRSLRARFMLEGGYLIVRGFFLKMVVADNLSFYVDSSWNEAATSSGSAWFSVWVAFLFSCQIFADFAGYSSIARGVAYTLGFRLPVNFRAPYIATTFSDFWRRWHISLSSWLRDYLYFPLGGNRGSKLRTYVNLFVVMFLGGLWHGAAWTFVIWGCLHGVGLAVERALGLNELERTGSWSLRLLWFIVVQASVLVAWVVFRAESADQALSYVSQLFAGGDLPLASIAASGLFVLPIVILHIRSFVAERCGLPVGGFEKAMTSGVMAAILLAVYGDQRGFIYFQF